MDVMEKLVDIVCDATQINGCIHSCNHPPCAMVRGIVDALIENGVTVQEWIPVTERLPDWRDGKVLVFTKYGFSICERTVNNRWRGQHANWITHWAYLPEPPKGE